MYTILDAKYKKSGLNKVMHEQCQNLTENGQKDILALFMKFEYLFGGKLGMWNTSLADPELEDNMKPVCVWYYPLPKVHENIFEK